MLINDRQRIVLQAHFRCADRVKDRRSDIAGGLGKISVVVANRRPRNILLRTKAAKRILLHQTAGNADCVSCDAPVLAGRKIVRCDKRLRQGIGGAQADGTAGRRLKIASRNRDRWKAMQRLAKFIEGERLDVKLDVGASEVW